MAAVREVAESAGGVDAALANHLIMGPAILARAGLRFAAKVHGSALEYTVKPNPERFLPYAREGMDAAAGVLVGSGHTAASLWRALDDPSLPPKTRLGPPGVDTGLFAPIAPAEHRPRLEALAADLRAAPGEDSNWDRDPEEAARAVEELAGADGPRVVFVGKLIVSKGVDLLLAAWPLVHEANPGARLLMVGFGEYEDASRRLWAALEGGDLAAVREVARRGRALEGGKEAPLEMLTAFLEGLPAGYAESARAAAGSVSFAGASSTTRSAGWCPRSTRWSCPARSRRRSGWWRPRRPPRDAARVGRALRHGRGEPGARGGAAPGGLRARLVRARRSRGGVTGLAHQRLAGPRPRDPRTGPGRTPRGGRSPVELGGRGPGGPGRVGREPGRAARAACAGCHQLRRGRGGGGPEQ